MYPAGIQIDRQQIGQQQQHVPGESSMTGVAYQQGLLSCGVEERSLREDIINLTREDERETSHILSAAVVGAIGAKPEESRQITNNKTPSGASTPFHPEPGPSITIDGPDQNNRGIQGIDGIQIAALESPPPRPACSRPAVSAADIRRVDLVGQAVTSMGLADAVDATLDAPRTTCTAPSMQTTGEVGQGICTADTSLLLWVLAIRRCQLSSLLPVAGLLYRLDGLIGLGIHDVAGLELAGVERVLADARCLSTLTIHRCGLVRLPRLQSGSIEVLDLSDNAIENTSGLETLFRLRELNLAGNKIGALTDLRPLVPLGAGCLRELNLHRNPLQNSRRYVGMGNAAVTCRILPYDQSRCVHRIAVQNRQLHFAHLVVKCFRGCTSTQIHTATSD